MLKEISVIIYITQYYVWEGKMFSLILLYKVDFFFDSLTTVPIKFSILGMVYGYFLPPLLFKWRSPIVFNIMLVDPLAAASLAFRNSAFKWRGRGKKNSFKPSVIF